MNDINLRNSVNLEGVIQGLGARGYSNYEIAVLNGFEGTEEEWLATLVGPQGPRGPMGPSNIYVGDEEPTDENVNVWFDTDEPLDGTHYPVASEENAGVIKVGDNLEMDEKNRLNAKKYFFNNINAVKQAKLKINDVVQTLGYYEPNDGGGALYLIREKTENDVEDNGFIHFVSNELVAELIVENNTINVKQFGAKGDGVSDDYKSINNVFKFVSNKSLNYTIDFLDGNIYVIKEENLFKDCINRVSIILKGKSTINFTDFNGYCFDNSSKMYFSEFNNISFVSNSDDSENTRTFMLCNTDYSVQSLIYNNCSWKGKYDKVFELTGKGNNSEFIYNHCYCNMDSTWEAFLYQSKTGSDDALNFWFNNLRYLANSTLIHLEKGGHVKIDNSHYIPTKDTYLFELGFGDEYGTSANGTATFIDNNSRYELRNEHSKVIKCFWIQAQVIFSNSDFSSSVSQHTISDDVYYFKSREGANNVTFENCKLFGKFYTYSQISSTNLINVNKCVLYGISSILDMYRMECDSNQTNYYNITFNNCKIWGKKDIINFTTNLFNNAISCLSTKTISKVSYSQGRTQPKINDDWTLPIYNRAFVKKVSIIPHNNGNGTKHDIVVKSRLGTVSSITNNLITATDDTDMYRFIRQQKLLINNKFYTITTGSVGNKTITINPDDETQSIDIESGNEIYLVLAKGSIQCAIWSDYCVPINTEPNQLVYEDITVTFLNGSTSCYGNILVDIIN